jgi:anti-anti-sigma factor
MDAPTVAMDVRHPIDGVAVIDIRGEVTSACEPVLMSAYESATKDGSKRLVLNFSGLEYMNSGGIGMLVTLLVRVNRQHQALAAYGLSDHYRQILSLTRLDEAIAVHEDEQAAMQAAAAGGAR